MSSDYHYKNTSRHKSHADIIIDELRSRYPAWVDTSELVELTQSMNIQARLGTVRDRYGKGLEVHHGSEEACYRLSPDAQQLDTPRRPKRIVIDAAYLDDDAIRRIRQYADALRQHPVS